MAEQVVADVSHALTETGHHALSDSQKLLLRGQIESSIEPSHPVHTLMSTYVLELNSCAYIDMYMLTACV